MICFLPTTHTRSPHTRFDLLFFSSRVYRLKRRGTRHTSCGRTATNGERTTLRRRTISQAPTFPTTFPRGHICGIFTAPRSTNTQVSPMAAWCAPRGSRNDDQSFAVCRVVVFTAYSHFFFCTDLLARYTRERSAPVLTSRRCLGVQTNGSNHLGALRIWLTGVKGRCIEKSPPNKKNFFFPPQLS